MKPKYAALAAAALADKIIGGSPPGTYTINILAPYFCCDNGHFDVALS